MAIGFVLTDGQRGGTTRLSLQARFGYYTKIAIATTTTPISTA